jgi:predicted nucleic acid-binding protein
LSPIGGQQQHKLLAPQLMVTEASSALHEMAWRGEITKPRAKTMLERFLEAPVEICSPDGLVQAAWNRERKQRSSENGSPALAPGVNPSGD